MKTTNSVLHTQLVELFEQHPYITCFSHDEKGLYFVNDDTTALHIHYNQVESVITQPDKVIITLGNEVIYSVVPSEDRVEITLPEIKE